MISLDRGLLKPGSSGDVLERHQRYADLAGELDVVVFTGPDHEPKTVSQNLRVFPTKSRKASHYERAAGVARELAKDNSYDLVVTQDFAAPAGARIKRELSIPWIVSVHGLFFEHLWLGFDPVKWMLFYRIKKSFRGADGFRVTNDSIKSKLAEWGIERPILVQPTPVDVKKFFAVSKPKNGTPRILYVGRLSMEKNIAMLIKSVRGIKEDFILEIVGEGNERKRLEKLASGDNRIQFLGPKSHTELPEIYRRADIFVLPSNTESFGKVLIEAGAAACALVATRTAGATSIIDDGKNGLLADIGDEQGLRKALVRLFGEQTVRERLGAMAQQMAKQYDSDQAVRNIIIFWQKIANTKTAKK